MKIDLLVFGPHPDDAELGMGGTLARHKAAGYRTAIIDLTQGEMNGSPAERMAEAEQAAQILGCEFRRNLGLPDRGLDFRDPEQVRRVANAIRTVRPAVVAINWRVDREPDHQDASRLMEEGIYSAGVPRYETELEAYKPTKVLYYFINTEAEPSFYVDITAYQKRKIESVFAHKSQFGDGKDKGFNSMHYRIASRDRLYGAEVGVEFAEGFKLKEPRIVEDVVRG